MTDGMVQVVRINIGCKKSAPRAFDLILARTKLKSTAEDDGNHKSMIACRHGGGERTGAMARRTSNT